MGKPLMIQPADDSRIEALKKKTRAKSKVDVVRAALTLLEADVERAKRIARWVSATQVVGSSGMSVLKDFKTRHRFKHLP